MAPQTSGVVSSDVFEAIRDVDIDTIQQLPEQEIRPIFPCLVRMALCMTLDTSEEWVERKKRILQKLSETEIANSIVSLLSVDFHSLEVDVKKEMMLRTKMGFNAGDSILIASLVDGLALEFERSDGIRKLRLVLSELFSVQSLCRNIAMGNASQLPTGYRPSELFDNDVYIDEVSDVLSIAVAELPSTLQLSEVAETLLHVKNGASLICRLVANAPETFHEITMSLISNGDKQDEDTYSGKARLAALRMLCQMNPDKALVVRAIAVDMCRMPGLAILVTLDYMNSSKAKPQSIDNIVSFISGIFLGSDDKIRSWFIQFIRIGQKKFEAGQPTTLTNLRTELQNIATRLLKAGIDENTASDYHLVEASSLLRLYCALRGASTMKFTDEESSILLNLSTTSPPPSSAGIKLISISLCILLSCSNLISMTEAEKKAISWLRKLIKEERYFGKDCKVKSSFGEMLLLIAIHFHSNQINAISELVCSTLGMKIPIRANNLARMKIIFTQEIFTDEMITAHAVKVPVTSNLNSNVAGFLPAHCIYQLLKSRAFTKHKVPIREWIYKQLFNAVAPIHPVLPSLIETYVNSVIVPNSKTNLNTNEPISEEDLLSVFKHKIYSSEENNEQMETDEDNPVCPLTTQMLLLYYILLYDDVRLANSKVIKAGKVKKYSAELMSRVPVFYLMKQARQDQQNYGALFSHMLRLVAAHYPHLCLVQDWLITDLANDQIGTPSTTDHIRLLAESFDNMNTDNKRLIKTLDKILLLPESKLWPLAPTFVIKLPMVLSEKTPRQVRELSEKVWWKLNRIFPDNLWVLTINALRAQRAVITRANVLTWDDIVIDPLYVLRCDRRVFRCAEIMRITLHVLSAFLAASKIALGQILLERPSRSQEEDKDREDLRIALIAAQESAAIQMLLECCMPLADEEDRGLLTPLREVQGIVCTHLHQVFILDINLAKLVHFQTYSSDLLPLTVSAVPSMHICLDFLPELLSQPDLAKQVCKAKVCSSFCNPVLMLMLLL